MLFEKKQQQTKATTNILVLLAKNAPNVHDGGSRTWFCGHWVFRSTAFHDINAVYSVDNIRVPSVVKLTVWCCVKSHDNYHVILHALVKKIELEKMPMWVWTIWNRIAIAGHLSGTSDGLLEPKEAIKELNRSSKVKFILMLTSFVITMPWSRPPIIEIGNSSWKSIGVYVWSGMEN